MRILLNLRSSFVIHWIQTEYLLSLIQVRIINDVPQILVVVDGSSSYNFAADVAYVSDVMHARVRLASTHDGTSDSREIQFILFPHL
jgi:hypothetical protein